MAGCQRLGDGHPLLLASANAPDPVVADRRVARMPQPKQRLEDIRQFLHVLLTRLPDGPRARRTRLRSEAEGVVDAERREVDVVLGAVDDVATVVIGDLRRGE